MAENGAEGSQAMHDEQFDKLQKWAVESGVAPESVQPPEAGSGPTGAASPPSPPGAEGESAKQPDTPAAWFSAKFPSLEARRGLAVEEVRPPKDEGRPYVKDVGEDFLAATLG